MLYEQWKASLGFSANLFPSEFILFLTLDYLLFLFFSEGARQAAHDHEVNTLFLPNAQEADSY